MTDRDVRRVFATFNTAAPAFAEESARHGDEQRSDGRTDERGTGP
jgi:hypothetical protein